jgi:hypothetical protein
MPGLMPGIPVLVATTRQNVDGRAFARQSDAWQSPAKGFGPRRRDEPAMTMNKDV